MAIRDDLRWEFGRTEKPLALAVGSCHHMLVTKVLRTQSGRVWLRQNVGIVGTLASPMVGGIRRLGRGRRKRPHPPHPPPPPLRVRRCFPSVMIKNLPL